MEENAEELNFLKGELKKIEDKIKNANFAFDQIKEIESITKLWELREIIKGKINDELTKSHQTGKYKPKRKGTAMSA